MLSLPSSYTGFRLGPDLVPTGGGRTDDDIDRSRLLLPSGGRVPVLLAPVEDVQRTRAPTLNDSGSVEDIGDDRVPGLGLMGLGELFRGNAEVEGVRVGDLQMVVVHGHGTTRNRVVAVADSVGDSLAYGAWWIPGLVFTHQLSGDNPARDGYMVHQEGFGPPQKRECMPPVSPVVGKVRQAVPAAKTRQADLKLGIERLETIGLAIECNGSVEQLAVVDKLQAAKDGFDVPPGRGFQATESDGVVQGNLNLLGVQVVNGDVARHRLVLPALSSVQSLQ